MELMNELFSLEERLGGETLAEILPTLALMLAPFAPYLAAELWEELGNEGQVLKQSWPAFDPELAAEDQAEIVVQVNGKLRTKLSAPYGTAREDLDRLAREDAKVQVFLTGKQVVKIIIVPDKLVNFVVK
jgi:leucyl-tRNA synthetase